MNKLCICIPTYNRPEAISEVLEKELDFLNKYSVELGIFDSSEDMETELIVKKYIDQGYKNLFYQKCDLRIYTSASKKIYLIYEEMAEKSYDYIWMIHDHTTFNETAFKYILEQLDVNGDFYFLEMRASRFSVNTIVDLNDFLPKAALSLARLGTAIVRRESFLKGTDWKRMSQKYLQEENCGYCHVGYYFERMMELKNPRIIQLKFSRECFVDFKRFEKLGWHSASVRICLGHWGSTLMALPDQYTSKITALQTQDKWLLSKYKLLEYKKSGNYSISDFLKYRKWIKLIMPENYSNAFWVAVLPYKIAENKYFAQLLNEIEEHRKAGNKICLYGAGKDGFECFTFLNELGVNVDSFLVTRMEGNPKQIGGCAVNRADEYLKNNSAFVIIAILPQGVPEVKTYLDSLAAKGADFSYIEFA